MVAAKTVLNESAHMSNLQNAAWARTLSACIGALLAGICGVQGLAGFLVYLSIHFITSAALLVPLRCRPGDYFGQSKTIFSFVTSGIFDNVLLFIVLWALGFGLLWVF
jgi:hypothetical protein